MEQNLILSAALEFQPFTVIKRRIFKLLGKKGGLRAGEWDGILHSCVVQAPESRGEKLSRFEKVTEPEW